MGGQYLRYACKSTFHQSVDEEIPSSAQKFFAASSLIVSNTPANPNPINITTPISPSASLSHLFMISNDLRELKNHEFRHGERLK